MRVQPARWKIISFLLAGNAHTDLEQKKSRDKENIFQIF